MIKVKTYTKPKTATGATTSPGGGVVYANTQASGKAGYADKAGHAAIADKAEYADKAGIAENVNIEAEVLRHFLRSDEEDIAEKPITFAEGLSSEAASTFKKLLTLLGGLTLSDGIHGITDEGVATLKEVVSAAFRSGALGSGFKLGNYSDSEDSYLEVDRLLVRKAAEFVKLVIRELQSVGGEIVLSPASMKISKVQFLRAGTPQLESAPLQYDVYRCSFLTKQGDEEITNPFVVNDLVRCQTFNIKEGTTANAKNKYYWRRVVRVGTDYIDILALSGGNYGDSQPEVGDELVQMGNTTDVARQSVLYLSAYGDDSPSIKLYKGVNECTLDGKEIFVVSRDEIYALASMFKLKVKDGDTTKETTLAEIIANVDGLSSTVAANKQELENRMSKIEQSTEKISLQVETTTNLKNCIVGSALRPWDDITRITAAHSQKVEITNGGGVGGSNYATFSASGATADTYTGLYFKDVRVTAGKTYVFSVWAKIVSLWDNGAYYSIKRFDGGTEGAVVKSSNISVSIGGWKIFTTTFTVPDGCTKLLLEIAVRRNGAISVCRPMIMEGTEYGGWSLSPYDKTEAGKLESGLKRAGIDLEDDTITATANKFLVKNNSGEVTASVNEKGVLEVGAGVFSGLIRKKMTEITPENLKEYVTDVPALALGNILIDFEKTGCFVKFTGNIKAMTKDDVVIVPPFYMPNDTYWGKLSKKTVYEAMAYVGQTIIVVNDSDTEMTTIGYTSMNFDHASKYFGRGQGAMITCVVNKGQNSCTVVWNGRQLPFFNPALESESDPTTTADEPITTTEEEQPKE